jgi:phosphoribosylamine--glycine ligase
MRVMVIGSGGREHALCFRLSKSPSVTEIIAVPGNPGIVPLATCLPIDPLKIDEVVFVARQHKIELAIVGPEDPLAAGLADALRAAGIPTFGPSAAGARIEADKWFAKELMKHQAIPTADARAFTDPRAAEEYVNLRQGPLVVKAAGLAKGKGVTVCYRTADALDTIDRIMRHKEFGDAGNRLVIEEYLQGPEVSVLAIVAGREVAVLDPCQDHKPVDDGDTGPMTGGMGAYCPTPLLSPATTPELLASIERDVLIPAIDGLLRDDIEYRGVLYAGLMLTAAGPKVLEFNCRFGDPETQPLMMRLQGDLARSLLSVANGTLEDFDLSFDPRPAVCVVAASKGYPGNYPKGLAISGIDSAETDGGSDVKVFHSGTRLKDGKLVTDGGRVLGVTALGNTHAEAQAKAYDAMTHIHFDGMHYRKDIAHQAVKPR